MSSSQKPLLVVPADDPVQIGDSPQLDRLRERVEVRIFSDLPATPEEQVARVAEADIMINSRGHVKWPAELLSQLPNLKMIATCSIGTDSVDLLTAAKQGTVVSNIPGKTAPVVAEHAFALMFAVAKRAAFQTAELKAGRWTRKDNIMLSGKTLGVVGVGSIGAEMARLGKAIGMNVIAWTFNPSPGRAEALGVRFVELDELLSTSDVVSLHVKLTPDSQNLIGRRELALMKENALLVNTARGAVLDIDAMIEVLNAGKIAGAALDVFEVEPMPTDHPILQCDQVILSPHNADQTPEGVELLNTGAVDNVLAFLDGKPQNVVS